MKPYFRIFTSAATASFLVFTTLAQESPNQTGTPGESSLTGTNSGRTGPTGSIGKGSKIIGMEVMNYQHEKLGKVDDLAVDLQSGRIVQVVLSIGGFLGIGDTLIAVPPGALHYDAANKVVHLDADKEKLKAAPRFETSKWEEYSQPNHVTQVYSYYGQQPYSSTAAYKDQTLNADRTKEVDRTVNSGTNAVADVSNSALNARDRNDQTLTPGDQGNNSADFDTTRRIRKEITSTKDMSVSARNVKIITSNGRVTLRGPVKTEQEKQLIGEIASRIAQPANVDNQLEVKLTATGRN
jgi:osmotically-inducible protein OsmY